MMEIEKKLALKDLKGYYEDQKMRTFAYDIIKYQLFQANKAVHKMSSPFSKTTTISYFQAGLQYIRNGFQKPRINKNLFALIDEGLAQHIQPLTPTAKERARLYKPRKKHQQPQNVNEAPIPSPQKPLTEKFYYAVKQDNILVIMENEKAAQTFVDANKIFGNKIVTIVTITIEEV